MSYSFQEPEWPAVCECKYDEARDEMDREDCAFHFDLVDDRADEETQTVPRKMAALQGNLRTPAA